MKKRNFKILPLLGVALFATSCGGPSLGDWTSVKFEELSEIDIGTNSKVEDGKLNQYTEKNPLKIGLVTDSGTLNDHSFNQSAWQGVNLFASKNGGGKIGQEGVKTGKIQTAYLQPTPGNYTAQGRFAAMSSLVKDFGADVLVLPGFLFQTPIKLAMEDQLFKDVHIIALDCLEADDDGKPINFTDNITSVIYREEQGGYLAGYAAVKEGFRNLGFVGGIPVPAVIKYGSGYIQGAAAAAKELNLSEPVNVQYYYAGAFEGTPEATSYASSWYKNGTADVIFACGGAVFTSVSQASIDNGNKPWIGVDVNQHANNEVKGYENIITSSMKNLSFATQVLLATYVNGNGKWNDTLKGNVVTVGAKSNMVKLPTPEEDNDPGCWGFKNYTVEEYNKLYKELQNGSIKINSNANNDELSSNNFGVDPQYCIVNYIG